jgi:hypothetical protein
MYKYVDYAGFYVGCVDLHAAQRVAIHKSCMTVLCTICSSTQHSFYVGYVGGLLVFCRFSCRLGWV